MHHQQSSAQTAAPGSDAPRYLGEIQSEEGRLRAYEDADGVVTLRLLNPMGVEGRARLYLPVEVFRRLRRQQERHR